LVRVGITPPGSASRTEPPLSTTSSRSLRGAQTSRFENKEVELKKSGSPQAARFFLMFSLPINPCERLLHAELNRYRQVNRHRFAVERRRLILPQVERVHRRLMEHRWPGNNFHCGYSAGGINQRVNFYVAAYALCLGEGGINRSSGCQQL